MLKSIRVEMANSVYTGSEDSDAHSNVFLDVISGAVSDINLLLEAKLIEGNIVPFSISGARSAYLAKVMIGPLL